MSIRENEGSGSAIFEPVTPTTIKSQVAHSIRRAILTGRLRPGDHISEASIAEQMGVSRAPIREALNQLKEQGLVVMRPHRGAFIRELRPDDVYDLIRLRAELEGYLGERLIDQGVSDELLESLRGHMAAMEEAAARDDFLGVVEHDEAFHQAMLRASNDGALIEVMQGIGFRIRTYMVVTKLIARNLDEAARDHQRIIDVLERGDRENVRSVMALHVTHYIDTLAPVNETVGAVDDD
ncbi:MAG TPA: GntR family transcriptional regulator [Trueperaceae bacterium]